METFGDRYRRALKRWGELYPERGGSELAFADLTAIPQGTLNPLNRRTDAPKPALVLAIARATHTDPGWLAFGADSQAPMEKDWGRRGSVTPDVEAVAVTRAAPAKKAASGGRKHR